MIEGYRDMPVIFLYCKKIKNFLHFFLFKTVVFDSRLVLFERYFQMIFHAMDFLFHCQVILKNIA